MKKNRKGNIGNYKLKIGKNYIASRSRIRARHIRHIRNIISATNDQLYWSDTHQLSVYLEDYHIKLKGSLDIRTTHP